ncbi:ABC transporter permease [Micromonospora craterilacus]|uniref:ABC transporter permease n=1 Tax=Micromonospora craterilacus TaxID=1655439 RepID=A0A2W2EWQ3_9ACTN|nr:ABC transporter permease [Micromonospora craterilacus]PZG21289.1 ABC transporter permease [Micromonospora craterilacus]
MSRALSHAVSAELIKLCGLPAVLAATLGTVAAATVISAALAASPMDPAEPTAIVRQAVPYLQVGTIVLGILSAGTEYAGGQIRTTLTALPDRPLLLAGKAIAYLLWAAGTAAAALAAGLLTAGTTLAVRDVPGSAAGTPWTIVGAAGYLVLIGLLGQAVAVLTRSLVPALVVLLGLLLVVSPLLGGVTEQARYLPDQAGALLYLPGADRILTPVTGLLVLLAWIATTVIATVAATLCRDA